jgi:hypothetical protein
MDLSATLAQVGYSPQNAPKTKPKIALHPFAPILAVVMEDVVAWIDLTKCVCVEAISLPGNAAKSENLKTSTYFSPDGRFFCIVRAEIVQIMDVTSGRFLALPIRCTSCVGCIAFHPQELVAAIGTAKGSVEFWSLESALPQQLGVYSPATTTTDNRINSLVWSSSGKNVMIFSGDTFKVIGWSGSAASVSYEMANVSSTLGLKSPAFDAISSIRLTSSEHIVVASMHPLAIAVVDLQHPALASLSESLTPVAGSSPVQKPTRPNVTVDATPANPAPPTPEESPESIALHQLIKETQENRSALFTRLSALRAVRALSASKGSFSALLAAVARQPLSIRSQLVVDILASGCVDVSSIRTVDDACVLLELLNQCLQSNADDHVVLAMEWIKSSFKQFGTTCAENFTPIRRQLHSLSSRSTPLGAQAKTLFLSLSSH